MHSSASCKNRMLCWNSGTDQVVLVPWPDLNGLSDSYRMSALACYPHVQQMSDEQRKALVFIEGMTLIIREGCSPAAVHQALWGLSEYRSGCPEDMPSAEASVIPFKN